MRDNAQFDPIAYILHTVCAFCHGANTHDGIDFKG
jgi:hypothetical protein